MTVRRGLFDDVLGALLGCISFAPDATQEPQKLKPAIKRKKTVTWDPETDRDGDLYSYYIAAACAGADEEAADDEAQDDAAAAPGLLELELRDQAKMIEALNRQIVKLSTRR